MVLVQFKDLLGKKHSFNYSSVDLAFGIVEEALKQRKTQLVHVFNSQGNRAISYRAALDSNNNLKLIGRIH